MQQMVGYRGAMCQQYIHSSTKPCKFEFVVAPRTMFGVPRSGLVTGTGANQARERVTFWTAAPLKQAIGMTFERRTLTCIRNTREKCDRDALHGLLVPSCNGYGNSSGIAHSRSLNFGVSVLHFVLYGAGAEIELWERPQVR
eukprot:602618-Prorocentrum_minimum.AAC.3